MVTDVPLALRLHAPILFHYSEGIFYSSHQPTYGSRTVFMYAEQPGSVLAGSIL
jgi:hypothetical protein